MNESDDFVEDDFQEDEVPQATDDFVEDDFEEDKPEKSILETVARSAGNYALGLAEASPSGIFYDLGVTPLASEGFMNLNERHRIGEDIEYLYEKNAGKRVEEWPKEDQELYQSLEEQIKPGANPKNVAEPIDLTLQGLVKKVTGVDLKPEGIAENAARWTGWIKDPRKLFELGKTGLNKKDLIKAIIPTGTEVLRGAAAGTALEMAAQGAFGPIGTLAVSVMSDVGANLAASAGKKAVKVLSNPRQAIAEVAKAFTKNDKLNLQTEIIKDFRDAGIQADIGTITDSDLVKWVQSRLAQSGLTGDALDELRKTTTEQIKGEYKALAEGLGEARFASSHEAGEVAKAQLKKIRDIDYAEVKDIYKKSDANLKDKSFTETKKLAESIKKIEDALSPGQLKSPEQQKVLDALKPIKRDIYDSAGNITYAKVKDLINTKRALQDIIDYEIHGGEKKLLKPLIHEIERSILSYGMKENQTFAKERIRANKKFSEHAKTFRNAEVARLLKDNDPAQLMNRMNTVHGIKQLEKILEKTPEGREVFGNLKRFRLDRMIQDNMVDSTTQQLKLGTFSKLLEKGKNRDIARQLLPKESFNRLKKLQKNSGVLADTAQKFFNSSKSGITLEDAGIVSKVLMDLGFLMSGNAWPLIKTAAGLSGARYLTKLMGDPIFLKMVEEMILAGEKNDFKLMNKVAKQMVPLVREALQVNQDSNQQRKL